VTTETLPKLLRAKDVAEMLAISPKTVYRLHDEGSLPGIRLTDRAVRFEPAAIEQWLEERRSASR
jgi:excisionase family DNA binding protein